MFLTYQIFFKLDCFIKSFFKLVFNKLNNQLGYFEKPFNKTFIKIIKTNKALGFNNKTQYFLVLNNLSLIQVYFNFIS